MPLEKETKRMISTLRLVFIKMMANYNHSINQNMIYLFWKNGWEIAFQNIEKDILLVLLEFGLLTKKRKLDAELCINFLRYQR